MSNITLDTIPWWCGETLQGTMFLGAFPVFLQSLSYVPLNLDSSRKGFTIQAQQVLPHLFRSFWDRYRLRLGAVPKLCHFFWVDFSSKKKSCSVACWNLRHIFKTRRKKAQPKHPATQSGTSYHHHQNVRPPHPPPPKKQKQSNPLQPYFSPIKWNKTQPLT